MISSVKSTFNSIKSAITEPIQKAKDTVSKVIDTIKGFFPISVGKIIDNIKLPHFSISGSFSLNPPSIPHFSVEWYRKAMEGGMILNRPTLFGMKNGSLLGAGEAGPEAVVGVHSLMEMIQRAVSSVQQTMTVNYGGVTINVYGAEGQDIAALADEIEDRINFGVARKSAAFA